MPTPSARRRALSPALVLAAAAVLAAPVAAGLVPQQHAEDAGLTRAWFTQAPIDPVTQRVVGAELFDGTLYVLGSSGLLQALDAETGAPRWTVRTGDGRQPSYGPSVHQWSVTDEQDRPTQVTRVGVVTGSVIHVLDAANGAEVLTHEAGGAVATAPAITPTHAFVPIMEGRLIGHAFDRVKGLPVRVASPGTLMTKPVLSANRVIWTTKGGRVYAADPKTGVPAYRFDVGGPLSGAPTVKSNPEGGDSLYFATAAGTVYAVKAERARPLWKRTLGAAVEGSVVSLGETVYVATDEPTLYALDAADGAVRWSVGGLREFVSASDKQLFALSPSGALGVLDVATGEPVDSWPATDGLEPVLNTESDRLYFVSGEGLIQCFHQADAAKPYHHGVAPAEEPAETLADDEPASAEPDDEPADEAPAIEAPAEEAPADDPFGSFGAPADDPGDEGAADDPFSGDPFSGL